MAIPREISNVEDIIDSRDITERIEYLEDSEDPEEQEELAALKALKEEAEGYCEDWLYGATLIRDSYFVKYAEEFANDIGAINGDSEMRWPLYHIDWEAAAEALKQDYTEVDFDGISYWVR